MKKSIIFFAFVFVITSFFSQNWCPPGAKWHIKRGGNIGDGITGTDGVIEMSYTTNTTVIGIPCKRLDAVFRGKRLLGVGGGYDITETYNTHYTYSNNNVVFLYNELNAFDTLVNFNALPGDKWLKPRSAQSGCAYRPVVTVTDTGHITINGFYLKHIKTIDSAKVMFLWDTIIISYAYAEVESFVERILFTGGWHQNLFPTMCDTYPDTLASDGPPSNIFRCYEDNVFPLYKNDSPFWSWSGKPCDYTNGIETIEKNNINLSLYPNPNNGSFEIELQQPTEIRIVNMFGEIIYSTRCEKTGKVTIDAADIAPGAYILKANTAKGYGQMKFIRQ